MTWLLVWIASIGVPAAMRPITGTATGRPPSSSGAGAHAPEIALDDARREAAGASAAETVRHGLRQLDHLDGARPVGQAADEAALLERRDQPVNARLGPQVQRILHLVEGGRHAGLLQTLMDEPQEFELLASQHLAVPSEDPAPEHSTVPKQIMNKHYMFHMCSATI